MEPKAKLIKTIKRPFDPRRYRLGICPPKPPADENGQEWTYLGFHHDREFIYFQWGVLDEGQSVH